jgi:hypothetical protein
MAKVKKQERDLWAEWQAIQLTPEEKAAARAELEERLAKAKANGVFERIAALRGKIKWTITYEEMADKEDHHD